MSGEMVEPESENDEAIATGERGENSMDFARWLARSDIVWVRCGERQTRIPAPVLVSR